MLELQKEAIQAVATKRTLLDKEPCLILQESSILYSRR